MLYQLQQILHELLRISCEQYPPMQLYIRMGFSSPVQASFFLVCAADSVGAGYCPDDMPRPDKDKKESCKQGHS